jgi:tetratricopeptide (TPR) repeat protein
MTTWNPRANELFLKALELPTPGARQEYLDGVCAGDAALRAEVEALLEAGARAGSFLESPARDVLATIAEPPLGECPGTVVGPYKLLEQIGEGGFGVVFLAEQQHPVRRQVALKVLKPGMDTRQVVARFEAERQALALMDHPNIAHILDGGATASGRPYFVMELVHGIPITKFCDQNHLSVRERLGLFVSVCEAVQHAHHKGIIHRDLKPSNLLVTMKDTRPVVKVIDFGVAKALGQELTDKTLFTGFAQMIGTPLYMSPEQAGMSNVDVDTRGDIYALGVLLYELLTGTTPFDRERLKEVGYDELRRIIREEEPPRPSTRLSTVGQAATAVAAKRRSDPCKLSRLLRGELDWIAMKALEKDRARRYDTASEFAADVEHYLREEPVLACPPSAAYRFRKFVRRHQRSLMMGTVVALALLVAAGSIGWGLARVAESKRQEAAQERKLEQGITAALHEAEQTHVELHRQLTDRKQVCELLSDMDAWDGMVKKAGRAFQQARRLADSAPDLLREALHSRLESVGHALDQDERNWKLGKELDTLRLEADTLVAGKWQPAAAGPRYERTFADFGLALTRADPAELATQIRQSPLRFVVPAALDQWSRVASDVELRTRLVHVARLADPDALRNQVRDAQVRKDLKQLRELAKQALRVRESPDVLLMLAFALKSSGSEPEAERFLQSVTVDHPRDFWLYFALGFIVKDPVQRAGHFQTAVAIRPKSAVAHNNWGLALHASRDYDGAISHFRQALKLDPNYAVAHNNWGMALTDKKDYGGAIRHFQEALKLNFNPVMVHFNLGTTLYAQKDYDGAISHFRQALKLNPRFASAHDNWGSTLHAQKDYDGAISHYRQALELDPNDALAHYNWALALDARQDYAGAITHYREGVRLNPGYAAAHYNWGNVLQVTQDYAGAISHYQEALKLDPNLPQAHINWGLALAAQKDYPGAITHYRQALKLDPNDARAHNNWGTTLYAQKDYAGAIGHFQQALKLDPNLPQAHINWGLALAALLAQGEFAGAEQASRSWLQLLSPGHPLRSRVQKQLKQCQQLLLLERRALALADGQAQTSDTAELLRLADFCLRYRRPRAAVCLYASALASQPALAEDRREGHRYNAACAAALAAAGQGQDADKLESKERVRLCRQALNWLRADLEAWGRPLDGEPDKARSAVQVARVLGHWLVDSDLASVRGPEALARMPEAERQQWQKLWKDVAERLARARAASQENGETR